MFLPAEYPGHLSRSMNSWKTFNQIINIGAQQNLSLLQLTYETNSNNNYYLEMQ